MSIQRETKGRQGRCYRKTCYREPKNHQKDEVPRNMNKLLVVVETARHGDHQVLALEHAREPIAEDEAPEDAEVGSTAGLKSESAITFLDKHVRIPHTFPTVTRIIS